MFDFLDDVFDGISSWFGDAVDAASDVAFDGGPPIGDGPPLGDSGSSWAGKLGSAALGAGVNIMKGGGSLGSRTSGSAGRIASGISVDRMGNERPKHAQGPDPLMSVNPQTMQEMWVNRMREFSRMNAAVGGKADASN
jgi:hypothetical protein